LKPHLKITKAIKGPGHDSSGGAPAKQVEDPEFRPQYCQTNSKKKNKKTKPTKPSMGHSMSFPCYFWKLKRKWCTGAVLLTFYQV
jgi:hypothetical protein